MAYRRKRSFRKRTAGAKRGRYTGRRPPRYRGSRAPRSFLKTKNLAMEISKIGENYINAPAVSNIGSSPFIAGVNSQFNYIAYNLGHKSYGTVQTNGPLACFNMPASPTNQYKYIKSLTSQFEIKMENLNVTSEVDLKLNSGPVSFTFMIVKPNSKSVVTDPTPLNDLWIAPDGTTRGVGTTDTLNTLSLRSALFNSKKFTCIYKSKFELSHAMIGYDNESAPAAPGNISYSGISSSQTRKNSKFIRVKQPIFKKTYMGDQNVISASPKSYMDTCWVIVYAYNLVTGARADNWTLSNNNSMSYNDF